MHRWLIILILSNTLVYSESANQLPWSFLPLKESSLPTLQNKEWPQKRLDHFILKQIESKNLQPATPADDRVLLRRLYFNLIGLSPTQEQWSNFSQRAKKNRATAIKEEINTLLASPHYGERWARHWLDLARYTDKTASWLNSTADAWRYRDWVVGAFNEDLPYNDFVKKQLANDLIKNNNPTENAALGFLGLSPTYWKELQLPPEIIKTTVADEWEERMDAVGRTFLGLTLGCARCHDHKFEPVSQADYYAIAGVFASVRIADRPTISEELWKPVTKARTQVAALEKQVATLKKKKPAPKSTGVRTPAFAEDTATAIDKLKPILYEPLNTKPAKLAVEKGVAISMEQFATFTSGRLHAKVPELGTAYTVGFWFRNNLANTDRPVTGYLFSRGADGAARAPGDHLGIGGTSTQARGTLFLYNGDAAKGYIGGKTVITPGTWNHVVLTRNGNQVTAWLNGASAPEFTGNIKATAMDSREFFLGGRNERFALINGRISHLAFFDRALTGPEAKQLHAAAGLPQGPIIKPIEKNNPALVANNSKLEIAKLEKEIASIKKSTPHYNMPTVNGVTEAALFVNPKGNGTHGTALDYKQGKARDLPIHKRGDPNTTGKTVPRRFLGAFPAETNVPRDFKHGSGRLDLAEAIVEEGAPLTARVIVNRVWQHHFGRGLCPTPSELGHSGEAPTHPELLQDLATRFIANGWSIKWLHREILQSATWQQGIENPDSEKTDPTNRHLARMQRRRLDVETWRDAMLQASNQMDLTLGGEPMDLESRKNKRRTLYGSIHRREPNQMLRIHDFPDPTAHAPTRPQTITPLQQLFSLNGPFILQQAEALAGILMKQPGVEEGIRTAYQKLFQRTPRAAELNIAKTFLKGKETDVATWTQYAHALLAGNEFQFID
ncbi:MAG: DUF1553 domain-containing protein [Verrucomicrobiota bacterium]|nr:DUF1553 domain-containing protein [Verrucomicrobiota bacterium]